MALAERPAHVVDVRAGGDDHEISVLRLVHDVVSKLDILLGAADVFHSLLGEELILIHVEKQVFIGTDRKTLVNVHEAVAVLVVVARKHGRVVVFVIGIGVAVRDQIIVIRKEEAAAEGVVYHVDMLTVGGFHRDRAVADDSGVVCARELDGGLRIKDQARADEQVACLADLDRDRVLVGLDRSVADLDVIGGGLDGRACRAAEAAELHEKPLRGGIGKAALGEDDGGVEQHKEVRAVFDRALALHATVVERDGGGGAVNGKRDGRIGRDHAHVLERQLLGGGNGQRADDGKVFDRHAVGILDLHAVRRDEDHAVCIVGF